MKQLNQPLLTCLGSVVFTVLAVIVVLSGTFQQAMVDVTSTPQEVGINPTDEPSPPPTEAPQLPTSTPTLTNTPTLTATLTSTHTATSTATPTMLPTATRTLTPTVTFTPLPIIGTNASQTIRVQVTRIREIGHIGGGAFLIFDALITNQTGRRGCVYDRDVQLHYPAGGNSAQTNLPNRTTRTSNVVAELRRMEPAYNGIEALKPQMLTGNFCLNAGQTRPTFLIYSVPEGWAAATLLIGGTQTINLCLARTDKVLNGFREIEAHTGCHFTFDWEFVGEVQLSPSEGFFFAAEMPATNCDSLTPLTVSRGAEVQQDKQPISRIQVNNTWENLENLLGSITLHLPFASISLINLVENHHKIKDGQRITITSTLARTVPSGIDAKYRFVWREYRTDGFLIINMQADAGYTLHSVRVPYSIYGEVRPSIEVVYERPCPTPTAAP